MSEAAPSADLLRLTARIVSAHASHNVVAADALPNLIRSVHAALENVQADTPQAGDILKPFVPPQKSVFPNYIVCLEDGRKLKMLKRHLQTAYQMTPQQYRQKWGLPDSYPMVAPSYAAQRSTLAKSIGLGQTAARKKPTSPAPDPEADPDSVPVQRVPEGVRGKRLPRVPDTAP